MMKSTKRLIFIGIVIIGIILFLGSAYYLLDRKDKVKEERIKMMLQQEFSLSDKIVEYGSEINLLEEKNNKEILSKIYVDDEEVTTYKFEKLGEVEFTEVNYAYYSTFFNKEKKIEVKKVSTYTVEDTMKPILEGVSDKTITVGEDIDLKEGITARDEVDGILEIVVEGEIDTNTVGEYNIKVMAKDKNENVTEDTYTLRVNSKPEVKKQTTNSITNKANGSTNKSSVNNHKETKNKEETEPATYTYETYGDKIYFEEDRGQNGNYSEKFTW